MTETNAAIKVLGLLQQLTLQACRSETRQELVFRIVNDTVQLCPYDRAVLLERKGDKVSILGYSGQVEVNATTQLAEDLTSYLQACPVPHEPAALPASNEAHWQRLKGNKAAFHVATIPVPTTGTATRFLWLERWGDVAWCEEELTILKSLADGYSAAFSKFASSFRFASLLPTTLKGRILAGVVATALLYVLFLYPFRLKVVANCEVVSAEPVLVTAPMDGVIEKVVAVPGTTVAMGAPLVRYDGRLVEQDVTVARRQMAIVKAKLEEARSLAFEDDRAVAQVTIQALRLEQEEARLKEALWRKDHITLKAPVSGTVLMENPHTWSGRSVRVGERIMEMITGNRTRVRLWIAEGDNLQLETRVEGQVFLNVDPACSHPIRLTYVAKKATLSPMQQPGVMAEADWVEATAPPPYGLKGTAIVYGPRVTVAYWIVRKPLAAIRSWLGI